MKESLEAHANKGEKVLCIVLSPVGQKQKGRKKKKSKRSKRFLFS